jgi:putative endonuclease
MTVQRLSLGRAGEDRAARFLTDMGCVIVDRNYRCNLGEIDIVARDGPVLVFVEVKTRTGSGFGTALESVVYKKQQKVRQVAKYYLQYGEYHGGPVRFDVIALTLGPGSAVEIEHVKNAF